MAKQSNIRWRDKDVENLRKAINNFNAKIRRVKKRPVTKDKPDVSEYQPESVTLKALKGTIETRADFNRAINKLKRYSRRGSEEVITGKKGLTLTFWEKNETAIRTATLNRKLTAEAKKAGISPEKGTSGLIDEQNLRHKKFSIDKTRKEFEKFKAGLEKRLIDRDKEKKLRQYHQNYKDAIVKFLGEDGDELLKYVEGITDFEKFFLNSLSDPIINIGFISDPLESKRIAEKALNQWKKVFK